jgi:transposase
MKTQQSIGIDVGKSELATCIRRPDGTTMATVFFPNTDTGLKKFIVHLNKHSVSKESPILLESTGPYHWKAASTLAKKGYFSKVVNPLHTKQILRHSIRKRKTDKVDASHLAFLASQEYGYKFVETEEMARKKALVRYCWNSRAVATRCLVREKYMKEYRGGVSDEYLISSLIVEKCEELKKEIVKQWSKGNDLRYLDSIPGVSPFIAATILAELTPLDRFKRIDQIIAFSGLDPSVKQSGGKPDRHGSLSKRGSPILRGALFLAAFGAFAKPGPMRTLYMQYKKRGMHHSAILCILGRKILRTSVALLRTRQEFDLFKFLSTGG